jgi:hypothetical protein
MRVTGQISIRDIPRTDLQIGAGLHRNLDLARCRQQTKKR